MAVNYQLPPWVKGANTSEFYARGFPLGLQAGEAAARLQHIQAQMQLEAQRIAIENQHTQMRIQLAQQEFERNSIQKQQELEVLKAYHEEQSHLKQEQIAQAEEKIQQAAAITAHKYQAQVMMTRRAQQLMAGGMKPEEAFVRAAMENPETSGSAMASLARAAGANATLPDLQVQNVQVPGPNGTTIPLPILRNPKTGHFEVIKSAKGETLKENIAERKQLYDSGAPPEQIAALDEKINKHLGVSTAAKAEPEAKPNWWSNLFKSKPPATANGEVPDWAALPGEQESTDQPQSSLSEIASRMALGPAGPMPEPPSDTSESDQKDWGIPKGTIVRGFEYLGGDPHSKESWDVLRGEEQQIPEEAALPGED